MKRNLAVTKTIAVLLAILILTLSPVNMMIFANEQVKTNQQQKGIELGQYIKLGKYQGQDIIWRYVADNQDNPLMLSHQILTIKPFNSKGFPDTMDSLAAADSNNLRKNYGSNLWADSTLRTWLNSVDNAGEVKWTQNPPSAENVENGINYYDQEKGFLAQGNFTEIERSFIKPTLQKSILNQLDVEFNIGGTQAHLYSSDIGNALQNYDDVFYHEVLDRVFLLDIQQLEQVRQNEKILGSASDIEDIGYLAATVTQQALEQSGQKGYAPETAYPSWTRTPGGDVFNPHSVRVIYPYSTVSNDTVLMRSSSYSSTIGVRPAFHLDMDGIAITNGDGSISNPYELDKPDWTPATEQAAEESIENSLEESTESISDQTDEETIGEIVDEITDKIDQNQYVTEKYVVLSDTLNPMPGCPDTKTFCSQGSEYSKKAPYKKGYVAYGYVIDSNEYSTEDINLFGDTTAVHFTTETENQHIVTFIYIKAAMPAIINRVVKTGPDTQINLAPRVISGYVGKNIDIVPDNWETAQNMSLSYDAESSKLAEKFTVTLTDKPQQYEIVYKPMDDVIITVQHTGLDGQVNYSYDITKKYQDPVFEITAPDKEHHKVIGYEMYNLGGIAEGQTTGSVMADPAITRRVIFYYASNFADVVTKAIDQDTKRLIYSEKYSDALIGQQYTVLAPEVEGYVITGFEQEQQPSSTIDQVKDGSNFVVFNYVKLPDSDTDNTAENPTDTGNIDESGQDFDDTSVTEQVDQNDNDTDLFDENNTEQQFVQITFIGKQDNQQGKELYRYSVAVQKSDSELSVGDYAVDLNPEWTLKQGQFIADNDKNVELYYESAAQTVFVSVYAKIYQTEQPINGFTPIEAIAERGKPFSFNAPYISGYDLVDDQIIKTIDQVSESNNILTFMYKQSAENVTVLLKEGGSNGRIIKSVSENFAVGESRTIPVIDLPTEYYIPKSTAQKVSYSGQPITIEYYYTRNMSGVNKVLYDNTSGTEALLDTIPSGVYRVGEVALFKAPAQPGLKLFDSISKFEMVGASGQDIRFDYVAVESNTITVEMTDSAGNIIYTYDIDVQDGTEITVSAPTIDKYTLKTGESVQKAITAPAKATFEYEQDEKRGQLTVVVTIARTGEVCEDAEVLIEYSDKSETSYTDSTGKVIISDAELAEYSITANLAGYHTGTGTATLTGGSANQTVNIALGRTNSGGGGGSSGSATATLTVLGKADDHVLYNQTTTVVMGRTETIKAPEIEGYTLISNRTEDIRILSKENTVVFEYEKTSGLDLEKSKHIKYINGYEDFTVRPDSPITRAEAAAIFYRLIIEKDDVRPIGFTDISGNEWFAESINYLSGKRILRGYEDGSFRPERTITRAEFATIASRFDNLDQASYVIFDDVIGHWAEEYVASAFLKGWVSGYPSGEFMPENSITRSEVVKIVNSMLGRRTSVFPDSEIRKYVDLNSTHWAFADIIEASVEHNYVKDENGYETWLDQ